MSGRIIKRGSEIGPYVKTRKITATGSKQEIAIPDFAYEAIISAEDPVSFYETDATYVENSITYGQGYTVNDQVQPMHGEKFWISASSGTIVSIAFICSRAN